jgi:hypothetical protein
MRLPPDRIRATRVAVLVDRIEATPHSVVSFGRSSAAGVLPISLLPHCARFARFHNLKSQDIHEL